MLHRLFVTVLVTGTLAGLLLTAVQYLHVLPIIFVAESYENSALPNTVIAHKHADHQHATETWKPNEGVERSFYTALSNIFAGIGFALILAGVIFFSGRSGWRNGLLWGFGGFIVFFVAPSLGLHPEIPGTNAADLIDRQLWWITTVVTTAIGLGLVIFNHSTLYKGIGVLLIVIPHLVGAPLPEQLGALGPPSLASSFILATTISNCIFWLVLGGLNGYSLRNQASAGRTNSL